MKHRLTGITITGEWSKEDWIDFYLTLEAFEKRVGKRHSEEKVPDPKWTVLYNISSPESEKWIGTGWEFFDSEKEASEAYQRHINLDNCPTKRPFHINDRKHLGACHHI